MIKKILKFLFEYDFLYTIPLGFFLFVLFGELGRQQFGDGFAPYSPEFFHSIMLTGIIVMFITSFIQMGLFFQFPKMYNYYLKNFNKIEPSWLKPFIFLGVFFLYFYFIVEIWKVLV